MTGGLIGVLGYDLVRTWERLPTTARRDLDLPLYAMIEPEILFIHDAKNASLGIIAWRDIKDSTADLEAQFESSRNEARRAYDRWVAAKTVRRPPVTQTKTAEPPAPSFGPGQFESAVMRAKEYIAAGDTYQVNLSLRTSQATGLKPEQIYDAVRRVNPSPYMGLLRLPAFALVCGSPELLVKLEDNVVSSRPIAGTRRRGSGPAQDAELSAELLGNDKERAEHLMLVDLIRNDIGRVAEFASVRVPEFMVVERYSHVMHIVSQVEGRLAYGKTWADVLQSMFPGGTITGCPKIRTMEIIEELEPVGRGYYTGAMGWISYAGEMEMNIVIRSMLVRDGVAYVQAGAGIVADSQPERELDEALRKARALWVALKQATDSYG
jgi:para-aminobenzoate synthetase component 1